MNERDASPEGTHLEPPMSLEEIIADMTVGFAAAQMLPEMPTAPLKARLARWADALRHHARAPRHFTKAEAAAIQMILGVARGEVYMADAVDAEAILVAMLDSSKGGGT